jgi:dipeptidyl aminopeptidase/acylaminoacyl peptidase
LYERPTPIEIVAGPYPQAAPVPIDDLVFSRGALDAAWSADGRQLFVSTNLTGRYNIWRMEHQQDSLQRMVDWFDKYLKGTGAGR